MKCSKGRRIKKKKKKEKRWRKKDSKDRKRIQRRARSARRAFCSEAATFRRRHIHSDTLPVILSIRKTIVKARAVLRVRKNIVIVGAWRRNDDFVLRALLFAKESNGLDPFLLIPLLYHYKKKETVSRLTVRNNFFTILIRLDRI